MKKLQFLTACLICCLGLSAQTVLNTGYLQITLHRQILASEGDSSGICFLDSASDVIYAHSGAGYKSITSVWDAVVGNWGFPDGVGKMTTISDTVYTICMDLTPTPSNYFSNINTANADSGILPIGATIYNIGLVFRDQGPFPLNAQGMPELDDNLKGAGPHIDTRNQCSDIWLIGVNSDSVGYNTQAISVQEEETQDPIPAVTVQWVTSDVCSSVNGVKDISGQLFNYIKAYPNPFSDQVNISFNMIPDVTKVTAQVYDVMGRKVTDFTPVIKNGFNSFSWNGTDADGNDLPTGTYLLKVTNGSQIQTVKLIKI